MTSFYPGPYGLEILYQVSGLLHTMELNLNIDGTPDIGDAFSTINAISRDASLYPLHTLVIDYGTVLMPLFNTAVTAISATLWRYTAFSYERTWISEYTMGYVGSNANPIVGAAQATFTFRSQNGGIMKSVLLESGIDGNNQTAIAALTTTGLAYANFFLDDDNPFVARDGGYPIAGILLSRGQNERVFRRRYR